MGREGDQSAILPADAGALLGGECLAPVKAVAAYAIGRGEDVLRLPMVPVSDGTRRKLEQLANELGLVVGVAAGRS